MELQLTEPQQHALDASGNSPAQIIDPRTNTAYVLIPAVEYETVKEIIEDEQRQRAIRKTALTNAMGRMEDRP